MKPDEVPVAVVGLGPVGATAALLLARQGVRVLAVDRDSEVFGLARAVALDDEALRVLQAAGLGEAERPALLERQTVRFRGRRGQPLFELPPAPSPYGHPSLAFFRQPELERALRLALARRDEVDVRLGEELVSLSQDADGVRLVLRAVEGGATREVRARVLLGCDGARSTVRRALGIRLRGVSAARRWLVVDTAATAPEGGAFEFVADPVRPWVHGALPGGAHRWELMAGRGEPDMRLADPDAVRRLLAERFDGHPPEILRADVYTFHARLARRWRDRRVLLCGDAAHLAPPFAGQGLSAGLRDAGNLAWKVAAVVQGGAHERLLDTYEQERLPHVLRMTALAGAMGAAVQTRRPRAAVARDGVLSALWRSPRVQAWAQAGGWKPPAVHARGLRSARPGDRQAGRLLPQPRVGGRPLDDLLGPGFALLADPAALDGRTRASLAALGAPVVDAAEPGRAVLVRPDRFVFGAVPVAQAGALVAELAVALGRG